MGFDYKWGKKVRANLGNGERVAFVIEPAYDVKGEFGPEQKYGVQGPNDADVHEMAYTELGPDEDVPGGFFTDVP